MERKHTPSMGRHKISLPQLRAEAAQAAQHIAATLPVTPGRALAAFKRAAPALGVSRRVVDLVDTLMSHSYPQDWKGGPGPGPLVWPSDTELEDRLSLRPSQRKVIVRTALDSGFIRLCRSPTGRRWGHRDRPPAEGGRITHAYGFDLSPLAERIAEFEHLAAEWDAKRAEGKQLRREIACLRAEVLALVELATAQGYAGEDWPSFAAQADALKRARGSHRNPLALVPIAAHLRALHVRVREQVQAAAAHPEVAKTVPAAALPAASSVGSQEEVTAAEPECRLPNTPTNQLMSADATVAPSAEGPNRPKADEARSNRNRPTPRESGQPTPASASALRGFVVMPDDVVRIALVFRSWMTSAKPGWDDLAEAALFVCGELGISKHAWGQACIMLGRMEAIATLAVVAARHARGEVRSPEALLRKLVELHAKGELRLDKSLFGLMGKLHNDRHRKRPLSAD